MITVAIFACLCGLGFVVLLPRIFFRRGRLNARWWLTASPFALASGALIASSFGALESFASDDVRALLAWPAIGAALAGIALIRWTLHTHARPVSLWHQADDRPDELVTRGAYAHVRHPFYASFLLILAGCALALPHALTLLALVAGFVGLDRTAAREERRLVEAFGHHYAEYIRRTGRFLPRGVFGVATGRRSALRPPMAAIALLLVGAPRAEAQRVVDRFAVEPDNGSVEVAEPMPLSHVALITAGGALSGAAAGAVFGLIAGPMICSTEVVSCPDGIGDYVLTTTGYGSLIGAGAGLLIGSVMWLVRRDDPAFVSP